MDYSLLPLLTKFPLLHFRVPHGTKLSKKLLVWLFLKGHSSQVTGYGSSTNRDDWAGQTKKELLDF